jgi:stage III sporulation protein AH
MKANFVIGKKQIILSALIVILGGAIYVNYLYANKNDEYPITETLNQTESAVDVTASGTDAEAKNYGDAQLVNGVVENTDDYFTKAALEKSKTRDEAVETVKSVLAQTDISAEEIEQASAKIAELSQQIEDEGKIENLIKAKGFTECVVYLDNESANVVVKSEGLTAEQAAQIKNIVLSEKDVAQENISITEVQ